MYMITVFLINNLNRYLLSLLRPDYRIPVLLRGVRALQRVIFSVGGVMISALGRSYPLIYLMHMNLAKVWNSFDFDKGLVSVRKEPWIKAILPVDWKMGTVLGWVGEL